jgi:hypothetical protein
VDYRGGENPDVQGLPKVELGGFEPPTSWVRCRTAQECRKDAYFQVFLTPADFAQFLDELGYAAICKESGTPGEKCPKSAQGGWKLCFRRSGTVRIRLGGPAASLHELPGSPTYDSALYG